MQRQSSGGPYPTSGAPWHAPGSAAGYPAAARTGAPAQPTHPTSYTTPLKGSSSSITNESGSDKSKPSEPSTQQSLAHALLPDLPLLMHGSGDVLPEDVDPRSVATLARLIEKYVASLVSAAMDAHDVFTDGEVVGGGACLGMPPFGAAVGEGESDEDEDDEDETSKKRKASTQKTQKRKKSKIDYWDVSLPPPGEDNDGDSTVVSSNDSDLSSDEGSDDDAPLLSPFRRMSSSASASSFTAAEIASSLEGFAPVDLHAKERTRSYYVAAPTVMDARSFIFPICHDAELYQRIKEVQASRRAIRRDVVDNTLMEMMKEEGAAIGRWGTVDMLDAVLGSASNTDGGTDADPKKGSMSPSKAQGKDIKKKDAEGPEKKSDGTTIVGAGLLDTDVEPSWPGLNSLLRGKLW